VLGPILDLSQSPLDLDDQTPQTILHHVVGRAVLETLDRAFLSERSRNEDEGNLGEDFPDRLESSQSIHARQGVVGNDKLRVECLQRADEVFTSLDTLGLDVQAAVSERARLELGIERRVLDE